MFADLFHDWRERRLAARLQSPNTPPAPAPLRFRARQWQFFGFALGVFVAALTAPCSGWILREQARLCASGAGVQEYLHILTKDMVNKSNRETPPQAQYQAQRRAQEEALRRRIMAEGAQRPDVESTIAHALFPYLGYTPTAYAIYWPDWMGSGEQAAAKLRLEMRAAMQRFPNSPLPCLVYLTSYNPTGRRYDRELHARYMEVTRRGERFDPDNALFPYLRILADYEANDENAAMRDLALALQKPRWNEYGLAVMRGVWQLKQERERMGNSQMRAAALIAIGGSGFQIPPMLAAGLLMDAERRERAGDAAGGIAIRGALLRIAVKMDAQSAMYRNNGSAQFLFRLACWRYDRSSAKPPRTTPGPSEVRNYQAYLRRHGCQAEAQWIEREITIAPTFQLVSPAAPNAAERRTFPMQAVWEARYYWIAGLCLLMETALLALLGSAVGIMNWRRRYNAQRPRGLSATACWGIGIGLMLAGSLLLVLRTGGAEGPLRAIDMIPWIGAACLPLCLLGLMRETRITLPTAVLAFGVVCSLAACILVPLGSAFVTMDRLVNGQLIPTIEMRGVMDSAFAMTFRMLALTALPGLAWAGVIARKTPRMPFSAALWRSISVGLLPALSLLLIGCGAWSLATARVETGANTIMRHLLDSDKRAEGEAQAAARQNAVQNKATRALRVLTGDIDALTTVKPVNAAPPK